MKKAFVPYSSGIVLLDQRSAGDPSFLLCRGSCMERSFHGIDVPRICLHKFGLLTSEKSEPSDNVTFLVEAPLHQVVINKGLLSKSSTNSYFLQIYHQLSVFYPNLAQPHSQVTPRYPNLASARSMWQPRHRKIN